MTGKYCCFSTLRLNQEAMELANELENNTYRNRVFSNSVDKYEVHVLVAALVHRRIIDVFY